jgi:hypothetical protein
LGIFFPVPKSSGFEKFYYLTNFINKKKKILNNLTRKQSELQDVLQNENQRFAQELGRHRP